MTRTLDVALASLEAPDRLALILPDRSISYAALHALVEARREALGRAPWVACVAAPTLDTFVTLFAALARGVPFVALHPRLPAAERAALLGTLERTPPPAGTAAVVWTSGTAGAPRGVCLSADNLVAAAAASAANLGWRDDDRWLCAMPLAHVGGLTIPVRCLLARRTVVALPGFEIDAVLATVERERVTVASFVPAMLARLLRADDHGVLGSLRAILLGGDAAPPALLEACRARGIRVLCTYGLTEAGGQVATECPSETGTELRNSTQFLNSVPLSYPLPGVDVRIVDGRIQVRGPTVAHAFLGEPPRAGDAWLDTGDLGELDARGLRVTGRAKDLIVTGGENVSPARVEAILGACPGVAAAMVYGMPDDTWGQIVCAALVAGAERPTDDRVLAHVAAALAPYERPRRLVWVEALPETPAGKRLRGSPRTPGAPPRGPAPVGTSRDRP